MVLDFLQALASALTAVAAGLTRLVGSLLAVVLMLVTLGMVLSIPAGFGYAVYRAFPRGQLPAKHNPGWLDTIFENSFVVFAARLVLLSFALVLLMAGIYIAISIAVRTWRREWLRRAGPFEPDVAARIEHEVGSFEDETASLLSDAWEQNEELLTRLEATLEELERVTAERDALVAGGPGEASR